MNIDKLLGIPTRGIYIHKGRKVVIKWKVKDELLEQRVLKEKKSNMNEEAPLWGVSSFYTISIQDSEVYVCSV